MVYTKIIQYFKGYIKSIIYNYGEYKTPLLRHIWVLYSEWFFCYYNMFMAEIWITFWALANGNCWMMMAQLINTWT